MKICSLYGAGFYYIPGTDTCLKVGGYMRAEVNFNAGGSFAPTFANHDLRTYNGQSWRSRGAITADARSQTAYGTLRSYLFMSATSDNSVGSSYAGSSPGNGTGATGYTRLFAPAAFIQWAGFTAGKTASFFDFDDTPYSNQSNVWNSANGGNGIEVWAYTAQFGNGLSASIAAENNNGHRLGYASAAGVAGTIGGQSMPDIVGNLRVDQAWGSAQVMGAAHQVNFGTAVTEPSDKVGYAVGVGLKVNLPMLGKGDNFVGQFTYGKGAIDYVGSGLAQAQTTVQAGITSFGPAWDAVVTSASNAELTTGWSVTGGLEHNWIPGWKSSLYGAYGKLEYSAAASAILQAVTAGTTAGSSANWSYWQVGSRTVWTPVENLNLSVEVMYQNEQSAYAGAAVGNNSWWSGMFRAQRNFWP